MKIRKMILSWYSKEKPPIFTGDMLSMDICFIEDEDKPVLYIDAGNVKIEDRTFPVDVKEILKKIGKIDFEQEHNKYNEETYSGDIWKLQINEKTYEGFLSDPSFVKEIKKIIRYTAIKLYAEKKLAKYISG